MADGNSPINVYTGGGSTGTIVAVGAITLLLAGGGLLAYELLKPKSKDSFDLIQPSLNPLDVVLGQVTKIAFGIKNNYSTPQTVKLHMDITEMGATDISNPGKIVDSFDSKVVTIDPGKSFTTEWDWTAKGALTGKWMVVSAEDESSALLPNVGPNNPNIYKQEFEVVNPNLTFNLLEPTITPLSSAPGTTVKIVMPVQNNGNEDATVVLGAYIAQAGNIITQTPGTTVGTMTPISKVIKAGQTVDYEWDWVASGAASKEWLIVSIKDPSGKLYPAVGPTNPNPFKPDGFEVTGGGSQGNIPGGGLLTISQPTGSPDPCIIGDPVTVTIPILITGTTIAQSVTIDIEPMAATTGALSIYDLDNAKETNIAVEPNVLKNITVTYTVKDLAGQVFDSNGLNERRLSVDCHINGQEVVKQVFQNVFNAKKGQTITPVIAAGYLNGVLNITLKNFTPNTSIVIAGWYDTTTDGSGSASASLQDTDPPGTYTVSAVDSQGVYAEATFVIPQSTPVNQQVSVTVMLIDVPDLFAGFSRAWSWQPQWFDKNHAEIDFGKFDVSSIAALSGIPAQGNLGAAIYDYNGNIIDTHYSQEYTLQNGETYVFDYIAEQLMTFAEYQSLISNNYSEYHDLISVNCVHGHRYSATIGR